VCLVSNKTGSAKSLIDIKISEDRLINYLIISIFRGSYTIDTIVILIRA